MFKILTSIPSKYQFIQVVGLRLGGVVLKKEVDHMEVLVVAGPLYGGVTRHVGDVGVGAHVQQQLDHLILEVLGGHDQGLEVTQGDVSSTGYQFLSHLPIPVLPKTRGC